MNLALQLVDQLGDLGVLMNKIYLVVMYDPMPYSDENDYIVCAYTNKEDAEK